MGQMSCSYTFSITSDDMAPADDEAISFRIEQVSRKLFCDIKNRIKKNGRY